MPTEPHKHPSIPRRKFLKLSAATMGALGSLGTAPAAESSQTPDQSRPGTRPARPPIRRGRRAYDSEYVSQYLNQVAFPMGGIGAGMICLEGTGALSNVSLRNRPEVFNEPCVFAAVSVVPHVLESVAGIPDPVVSRRVFFRR